MAPCFIRPLKVSDAGIYRTIRLEALLNHPECFGADYAHEQQQPLRFFQDRLLDNTLFGSFNAEKTLSGTVGIKQNQGRKTRHIATLWGMYVIPAERGSGLSGALMDRALSHARQHCQSLRLSVTADNNIARRFYHSLGFVEWATEKQALRIGDKFYDDILMRLDF